MKVLHVIPTLASSYGGPSHAIVGMVRRLGERGVSVTVATTAADEPEVALDLPGVKVVRAPRARGRWWPASFAFSPALADWLERSVREFDLVHVHTVFNHPASSASAAARRYGVPFLVRPCGMLDPWSLRRRGLKKRIWMALRERRNLDAAAALHFTSVEEELATHELRLRPPGFVIPLGVELPAIRRERRAQKTVLFLSRLHPKKGLDLLIPALGELAKERDDFAFVLAGTGEPAYEREISDLLARYGLLARTTLSGFVSGSTKVDLLARADVFVLPSYQENFGIAVAEALAAGLPVVISDRVNIFHDVMQAGAGLVGPPTIEAVAAALRRLLDDDVLRERMGQNAHKLAQQRFSWNTVVAELFKSYQQVLVKTCKLPERAAGPVLAEVSSC